MKKADMVQEINALEIKGLIFDENTEVNNSVLEGILALAKEKNTAQDQVAALSTELSLKDATIADLKAEKEEAEALVQELNATNSELTDTVARLKKAGGKPVLPTVTIDKVKHVFAIPAFQLPKCEPTTAEAVAERNNKEELAECVKRGVLVPVKKEG